MSGLREVVRGVGVVHRDDLLDDNGAFIQFFGDKVCGGPNDLDVALKGLLIRPRPGERGQV